MPRTLNNDREDALVKLRRNIQPDAQPSLTNDEVEALLDENQLANFWAANTEYVVNDVVMSATPNGHRYRCIIAGTSGATEPIWPTDDRAKIGDGSTRLQWKEDGPDYSNIFDIRAASYAGCKLHQQKAAPLHDIRSSASDYSHSQVFAHWGEMAKQFKSVRVG